jgi:hypothetical protein
MYRSLFAKLVSHPLKNGIFVVHGWSIPEDEIVLGRMVLNRLKIVLDGPAAITEIGA